MQEKKPFIKVTKDGPYLVFGITEITQQIILTDEKGISVDYGDGETFRIKPDRPAILCRCGRSKKAPFCDGAHTKDTGFDGTETAGFERFADGAEVLKGPEVTLLDNRKLCACARFCDAEGEIWNLVETCGEKAAEQAILEANLCPAGRLIILDKTGKVREDELPQGVTLLEDPSLKISGPIWVKGGIRVQSESGECYEVRTKQTLCRCGRSTNKPFCNGAHVTEPGWHADYPQENATGVENPPSV